MIGHLGDLAAAILAVLLLGNFGGGTSDGR